MMTASKITLMGLAKVSNTGVTDAALRAWGSALNSVWSAAGLVQTADTGQINWATITSSTTATLNYGYEVWRFNDSLQATCPIFVIITYGTTNGFGQLSYKFAASTDGAGNTTSPSATGNVAAGSGLWAANWPALVSGDGSSIAIALGLGEILQVGVRGTVLISRSRDSSGAYTAEGFWFMVDQQLNTTSSSRNFGYYSVSLGVWVTNAAWVATMPAYQTTGILGSNVNLYPLLIASPQVEPAPNLAYGVFATDFTKGSTFTFNGHTYVCLGNHVGYAGGNNNAQSLVMRYE